MPAAPPGEPRGIGWYIQLMPAFEQSITPSAIDQLGRGIKGIYRYLGGKGGQEVVYIGKGAVKDRYLQEKVRREWNVSKIEYSHIEDDQTAYEWEAWWIARHREEHGDRPIYNLVDGHSM